MHDGRPTRLARIHLQSYIFSVFFINKLSDLGPWSATRHRSLSLSAVSEKTNTGTKAAFAWAPSCTPSFQHTRQWFLCRSHSSVMPRDRPVGSLATYFTCSFILPLRARLIIIVFSRILRWSTIKRRWSTKSTGRQLGTYAIGSELWNFWENLKIHVGSDDKLRIQFALPNSS